MGNMYIKGVFKNKRLFDKIKRSDKYGYVSKKKNKGRKERN